MKFRGTLDKAAGEHAVFELEDGRLVHLGRLTEVDLGEYETQVDLSRVRHLEPGTAVHIIDEEDDCRLYTDWQD